MNPRWGSAFESQKCWPLWRATETVLFMSSSARGGSVMRKARAALNSRAMNLTGFTLPLKSRRLSAARTAAWQVQSDGKLTSVGVVSSRGVIQIAISIIG